MATRRQVSIFINGKEIAGELRSIYAEKRKITAELNRMTIGSEEYTSAVKDIRQLNGVLDEHRKNIGATGKQYDIVKSGLGAFAGVAAAAFTTDAIIQYGKELFKMGVEIDNTERKARTVFAQALQAVDAAAKQNAENIGLTTNAYVKLSAEIGDLLVPMGFQREEAAKLSTSTLDLAGALSEWTGGQYTTAQATEILRDGILGERDALKQLGISLEQADIDARLAEKGLKELTGQARQQAEAMATLEIITERSADAQRAFGDNAESSARKQAQLTARFQEIKEQLATATIPVFERLISFAEGATEGLTNIGDAIGRITSPAKTATAAFDEQTQRVASLESELVPLLDRYDELQSKSKLNKAEQAELSKVIQEIGDITPGAVTAVDDYGRALSINAGASREFLEAERARLQFTNQEAIRATDREIQNLREKQQLLKEEIETRRGITAASAPFVTNLEDAELVKRRTELAKTTNLLIGAEQELKRLRGEPGAAAATGGAAPTGPSAEERAAAAEAEARRREAAEKAAEERQKEYERQQEELKRQLESLQDITAKFYQEQSLAALTEDERKLEQVRLKYEKEIQLAKELEAQGVKDATTQRLELERLRDEELNALRDQQSQENISKEVERLTAQNEAELLKEEEFRIQREEIEAEIKALKGETTTSEYEQEIAALEAHIQELLNLADAYGISSVEITEEGEKRKRDIQKKYTDEQQKEFIEKQKKQLNELAATYGGVASIIGSSLQLIQGESAKATALQKVLTLAQIFFSLAEGISKAVAAGAGLAFPANIPAIAIGVGAVVSAVASAQAAFAKAPSVPQRKTGRWLTVKGQDDNIQYNAQHIGSPDTGLLPDHPVLINSATGQPVLASETGPEYFVSAKSLKDRRVFNLVRAIDNITRVRQFQEGGFTGEPTTTTQEPGTITISDNALLATMQQLLAMFQSGMIYARIDDDTLIDIRNRLTQLDAAAGG